MNETERTPVGADDLEVAESIRERIESDPGPDPAPPPDEPVTHGVGADGEDARKPVRHGDEKISPIALPPHVEALIEQLAYRTLFLEAALTVLARRLVTNNILPRDYEDRLIGEAEDIVEQTAGRHTEKGRAGLVGAFLDTTRSDD